MMITQNNILIIGGDSKIAKTLTTRFSDFNVYSTSRSVKQSINKRNLELDVTSVESMKKFFALVEDIEFIAVFYCASIYEKDMVETDEYADQIDRAYAINARAPLMILKKLKYCHNSVIFLFGDSGLTHPKKGFTNYTLSKSILSQVKTTLAVELSEKTAVFLLMLGPTHPAIGKSGSEYFKKNLYKVDNPTQGLIDLCRFIITNKNLSMTSTTIEYDGGTYLRR